MSPNTVTAQITPVVYEQREPQTVNDKALLIRVNLFDKDTWYILYIIFHIFIKLVKIFCANL